MPPKEVQQALEDLSNASKNATSPAFNDGRLFLDREASIRVVTYIKAYLEQQGFPYEEEHNT